MLRLPARALLVGWFLVAAAVVLGWMVVGPELGAAQAYSASGLLGSAVSLLVMGVGLGVIRPWVPKHASDLPTTWLATSVVRLLVVPTTAFLLYFAILPSTQPFVIGVVSAYVVLLAVEVLLIVLAMQRQFEKCESSESMETD